MPCRVGEEILSASERIGDKRAVLSTGVMTLDDSRTVKIWQQTIWHGCD